MGMWSKLFGTEKVIDGVYNGVDKSFFTEEEKADYLLMFLKAYEPFKLLQRLMALMVGIPYIIIYLVASFLFIYGVTIENIEESTRMIEASKELSHMNNEQLGMPFSIILSFAFGGGMIEGGIRAYKRNNKQA
mgnify:CR=1 FL=1